MSDLNRQLWRLHNVRSSAGSDGPADYGFTLIEVLVVIAILAILAVTVVVAVGGLTGTSVQAACKSDYNSVVVAVETFKAQEGLYPTAGQNGISGTNAVPGLLKVDTTVTPHLGPWLRNNPVNSGHYQIEASADGTGTVQVYTANGSATIPVPPTGTPTQTSADCSFAK